jgi:hypothetical protein
MKGPENKAGKHWAHTHDDLSNGIAGGRLVPLGFRV